MARHMPAQRPHRSRQGYTTPESFLAAVRARLGITHFQHDFAATRLNSKGATYWGIAHNSLAQPPRAWKEAVGRGWGWLNPPFTDIAPWAERCAQAAMLGTKIAFLTPASVGANWFRDYVDGHATVLLLNGRLAFTDSPYPKDCILSLYGADLPIPSQRPSQYEVWTWAA